MFRLNSFLAIGCLTAVLACDSATTTPPGNTPACQSNADCDDGLFCNGAETCDATLDCQVGTAPSLDDGIPCTVDACDENANTVTHVGDNAQCADTDPCTNDVCQAGTGCTHPVICTCTLSTECDDQNPCTDDSCTPQGNCAYANNSASCNDSLFCTGADTCGGGSCSVHAGDPCAGGAACANVCDEANNTCNLPSGTACGDDANPCTNDQCNGSGSCAHPNNSASCNDNLYCNGADTCSGGSCSAHAGDPCTGGAECANACDETGDSCNLPSGTACSADGNACTNDQCNGGGACTHPNNSASCTDNLFCNGADTCGGGTCSVHAGDPCTGGAECANACDETGDSCNLPSGTACTADGNPCTNDQCNGGGTCAHPNNSAACSDNLFCNGTDTCSGGACSAHSGDPCSSGAECANLCNETGDTCNLPNGTACTADSNPCTNDQCNGGGTCAHPNNAASCNDNLFCNGADTCSGGACNAHAGDPCLGGPECANACDEAGDSCNVANGTACTADGNPCTNDQCNGGGTCTHPNNSASCSDILFCNGTDTCSGGTCSLHAGDPCSGGAACNATCNESGDNCYDAAGAPCADTAPADCLTSGCSGSGACDQAYAAATNGAPCDDALFCTGADTCDVSAGCTVHAGDPCTPVACDETNNVCLTTAHFVRIVSGQFHSCGLTVEGVAYCWGQDSLGSLGNGGGSADTQDPSPVDTTTVSGNKAFVDLATGHNHTCGLTAAGVAYCWGYDAFGQLGNGSTTGVQQSPGAVVTTSMSGNKAFTQLTAGQSHTCGLTADGVAYCWGIDLNGQLGNGGTAADVIIPSPVSTTPITGNKTFVHLAAGQNHTCGLTADGVAYCWGRDNSGQLGNGGTSADSQSPTPVDTTPIAGNKAFVQLTGGLNHTCGLTVDGVAYCWGTDAEGELGDGGSAQDTQSPSAVDTTGITGNAAFVRITAGRLHTCGVTAARAVYCWGDDFNGQLGNGSASGARQSPSAVDTSSIPGNKAFVALSAGGLHNCGVTADGTSYCWGSDSNGQLGNGGTSTNAPGASAVDMSAVVGDTAFAQLRGGVFHTCGFTVEGVPYCWGRDLNGQLGNGGTSTDTQSPSAVDTTGITGNKAFVQMSAGSGHSCGIAADGSVHCWGSDSLGQLGNGGSGSLTNQLPSAVDTSGIAGNKAFVELTTGRAHTCGLTAAGVAYCWGDDGTGQLGNGGTSANTQSPSAVDISGITGNAAFVHLNAGDSHTCAVTVTGVAYCWGSDQYGQLGNGGTSVNTQSPSAVDTSGITGNAAFAGIDADEFHTCGLTVDGVAYCWGSDASGALGNGGTSVDTQSPSLVDTSTISGNKAFVRLSVGLTQACGLTADRTLYCWGDDFFGELGNGGSSVDSQSPSLVNTLVIPGNRAFIEMTSGSRTNCGLTASRNAYCWGSDSNGQLGNAGGSTTAQSPSPVDVSSL